MGAFLVVVLVCQALLDGDRAENLKTTRAVIVVAVGQIVKAAKAKPRQQRRGLSPSRVSRLALRRSSRA